MEITRLDPSHVDDYRALMLRAYADEPEAFTSTVGERQALPRDWWKARLSGTPEATQRVLGAFAEGGLVGVAGVSFGRRERTRHRATLFGMFVLPGLRRRGVGRALVEAALDTARSTPGTRLVRLTVTRPNAAARRLYESCGFRPFGIEPQAIRSGDCFLDKVHMWRLVEGERDRA